MKNVEEETEDMDVNIFIKSIRESFGQNEKI